MSEMSTENLECQRIIDAVIDYTLAEVRKKMELHGIDFDLALEMQRAVIIAEGSIGSMKPPTDLSSL